MNRKIVLLAVCAVACSVAACLYFSREKPAINPVRYVDAKVSQENVTPGFTPVLIFRVNSLKKGSVNVASSTCGTAFVGRSGKWKVITAAHVFSKDYQNYFYLFRRLRPHEQVATMGASSVMQISDSDSDVAECEVGEPQRIKGFSAIGGRIPENRTVQGSYRSLQEAGIVGFKSFVLTSVVSGKNAKIYAVSAKNYGDTFRWIIGYLGIGGESGTGFVDEHGRLYILSGGVSSETIPKDGRDTLKIPPEGKGLSIVSGPFDVLSPQGTPY